jgi:hypothetical protein
MPRCPICGEPTLGVCCDVLMDALGDDDGDTIVRGGD